MAAGNPNYDALLSSTIKNYRRQFSDNLSRSFFLMYWLTRKNKKTERDGGTAIVVPLMYGRNTTVRSYDGYETLDTTPQEGLTAVEYPWKHPRVRGELFRRGQGAGSHNYEDPTPGHFECSGVFLYHEPRVRPNLLRAG